MLCKRGTTDAIAWKNQAKTVCNVVASTCSTVQGCTPTVTHVLPIAPRIETVKLPPISIRSRSCVQTPQACCSCIAESRSSPPRKRLKVEP
eukprot:5052432-Amphidinium_carterae.1